MRIIQQPQGDQPLLRTDSSQTRRWEPFLGKSPVARGLVPSHLKGPPGLAGLGGGAKLCA